MAEDWNAIAGEVAEAIKSVASTDDGFPVTLRRQNSTGGNAWDPTDGTWTISYHTLHAMKTSKQVRDVNGSLTGKTSNKLVVAAEEIVPDKNDRLCIGFESSEVTEDSTWLDVADIMTLDPFGVAVLYEIELAD